VRAAPRNRERRAVLVPAVLNSLALQPSRGTPKRGSRAEVLSELGRANANQFSRPLEAGAGRLSNSGARSGPSRVRGLCNHLESTRSDPTRRRRRGVATRCTHALLQRPTVSCQPRDMFVPLLLVAALLGDVPSPKSAPPTAECVSNAECTITTNEPCCGSCCPNQPSATTVKAERAHQAQCAVIDCDSRCRDDKRCAMVDPPGAFVAQCQAGRCVAVRTTVRVTECQADSDCRVDLVEPPADAACHRSACGCCPQVSVGPASRPLVKPQGPRPAPQKASDSPHFGLSDGKGGPAPAPPPQCSPCAIEPARAACVQGRCQGAPMRPRPQPAG
jgi:hypothetical protein